MSSADCGRRRAGFRGQEWSTRERGSLVDSGDGPLTPPRTWRAARPFPRSRTRSIPRNWPPPSSGAAQELSGLRPHTGGFRGPPSRTQGRGSRPAGAHGARRFTRWSFLVAADLEEPPVVTKCGLERTWGSPRLGSLRRASPRAEPVKAPFLGFALVRFRGIAHPRVRGPAKPARLLGDAVRGGHRGHSATLRAARPAVQPVAAHFALPIKSLLRTRLSLTRRETTSR